VGLIAAGANHSLAVKAGGGMYAWGNNANSQLGTGNNTNSNVPVLLANPSRVVAISGGARHTAALDADRKLFIWGDNFFGQVGNRSGNYSVQSAFLNVLRGDSRISEGTSGSGGGVGTGSNSGSSVLEIDGQATSFDFGSLAAGGLKTTNGKYRNESSTNNITGLSLAVTGVGFSLQSPPCPSTLTTSAPDNECSFTIAFNPNTAAGFSGELEVTSSLVGSPERRSLFGTGVATAAIAFAKNGMDFPPQTIGTSSAPGTLTLTNTGNATLTVSSPIVSTLGDFAATHNCALVAPNGTCTVSVVFSPSAPNGRTGYLTLNSDAAGAPHTFTVNGTGVAPSPVVGASVTVVSVVSRKVHGNGTFSYPIEAGIDGAIPVEPRASATHPIVFLFSGAITFTGTATVRDANNNPAGSATLTASGSEVIATLSGVTDNRRVTVSLQNVNNAGVTAAVAMGFLAGDVNATRAVTASDILRIKGRIGQTANSANYGYDLDLSGAIDAADLSASKARSGLAMP
jgi:hypothetical protein